MQSHIFMFLENVNSRRKYANLINTHFFKSNPFVNWHFGKKVLKEEKIPHLIFVDAEKVYMHFDAFESPTETKLISFAHAS